MTEPIDFVLLNTWIAALESGTYEQGTGVLRSDADRYCCLGVLCDLDDRTKWITPADNPQNNHYAYGIDEEHSFTCFPPDDLLERVAINREYKPLDGTEWDADINDGTDATLVVLNDRLRFSFIEIAKILRKHQARLTAQTVPAMPEDAICDGYHEHEGDPFD